MIEALILAAATIYRLELVDNTPFIVGQDGARREVRIVDPDEYAALTGNFSRICRDLNKTEDGRRQLHGKVVSSVVAGGVKTDTYEDGYKHEKRMPSRTSAIPKTRTPPMPTTYRNPAISDRQQRMRELVAAAKSAKPKEVTIVHDAATGKDTEK